MPILPFVFAFVAAQTRPKPLPSVLVLGRRARLGRALLTSVCDRDRLGTLSALRRGADPNFVGPAYAKGESDPTRRHTTALILATEEDDLATVEILLARDARTDLRDENGNTALHQAADGGFPAIARRLLQRGADYRIQNQFGFTPLDLTGRPEQPAGEEASAAIARMIEARMKTDRRSRPHRRKARS